MKNIIYFSLLFVLVVKVSANPYKGSKNYDSEHHFEKDFHGISDRDMHDTSQFENKYTKLVNGKAIDNEKSSDYWLENAKAFVQEQLKKMPSEKKAKNIIMFLGDGMSHPTIASARVQMGGEEKKLYFENFPNTASSKTYCVDKQVADSACSATAYLTGVKANDATIGLNAQALRTNCLDGNIDTKKTESIASWAMKAGKDAGFVTTTRVTHASPTGVYGNIADRDWEYDGAVEKDGCDSTVVDDIAEQLVYNEISKKLKVMMGGGSRNFVPETEEANGVKGYRTDGKNLIEEWKSLNENGTFISTNANLTNIDPTKVKRLLGIFSSDHISYNLDIQRDGLQELMPSLTNMTLKAIDILSQNDEGYFLFVEGGRIDHGHHKNYARYAVDETVEFSNAIEAAVAKVNLEETLIVVTADHGHVMTLSGYAARGNDIFGYAGMGTDNLPYMTLSYANGEGYGVHRNPSGRVVPGEAQRTENDFQFPTTLPVEFETHGGEDVGIWAVGPWSHLFQGTLEQNVIPHIMAYASCIGYGLKNELCDE